MYKYTVLPILLLLISFTVIQATETTPVTFINENPGVTILGLAKFIVNENGNRDYKLMNMRWEDEKKVINLEPGVYGVTQYAPIYNKIMSFQIITVGTEPMIVTFRRL